MKELVVGRWLGSSMPWWGQSEKGLRCWHADDLKLLVWTIQQIMPMKCRSTHRLSRRPMKTTPLSKDRAQESGPSQLPCACWLSVPWAGSAKSAVPPEMDKLSSGVPPLLQSLQHTFLAALEIAVRNVPSSKPLIASCNEIHSHCLQYYIIFLYTL